MCGGRGWGSFLILRRIIGVRLGEEEDTARDDNGYQKANDCEASCVVGVFGLLGLLIRVAIILW